MKAPEASFVNVFRWLSQDIREPILPDIKRDSDLHCMGSHVFKQL